MTTLRFTWREDKNRANRKNHDGIVFEEAVRVFHDPFRLTVQDRIEGHEERWQTIGVVRGVTVLLVAHTLTEADEDGRPVEVVHIISARRVTPKERKRYETEAR